MRVSRIDSVQCNPEINFKGRTRNLFMKTLKKNVLKQKFDPNNIETLKQGLLSVPELMMRIYNSKEKCRAVFSKNFNKLLISEPDRTIMIFSAKKPSGNVTLAYIEDRLRSLYSEKIEEHSTWFLVPESKIFYREDSKKRFKIESDSKKNPIKIFLLDCFDYFFVNNKIDNQNFRNKW